MYMPKMKPVGSMVRPVIKSKHTDTQIPYIYTYIYIYIYIYKLPVEMLIFNGLVILEF